MKPALAGGVVLGMLVAATGTAKDAGHAGRAEMEAAMKTTLGPVWPADDIAAGDRMADRWRTFASSTGDDASSAAPFGAGQAQAAQVLARHQDALMAYPNVVAVSDGVCTTGADAGRACINVYVREKVAPDKLSDTQKLPETLEGVRIEVIEAGEIGTLPMR